MRPIPPRRSCLGSAAALAGGIRDRRARSDAPYRRNFNSCLFAFIAMVGQAVLCPPLFLKISNAPCLIRAQSGRFALLVKSTSRVAHFAPRQSPPFQCPC